MNKPRPAREVICKRCGIKFWRRGAGKREYCVECQVTIFQNKSLRRRG